LTSWLAASGKPASGQDGRFPETGTALFICPLPPGQKTATPAILRFLPGGTPCLRRRSPRTLFSPARLTVVCCTVGLYRGGRRIQLCLFSVRSSVGAEPEISSGGRSQPEREGQCLRNSRPNSSAHSGWFFADAA